MLTAWIDFWTTNSSIGYNNWIDARLVKLYKWGHTDRTSIFYSFDNDGIPIVWEEWYQEVLLWERGRLITSPKKFLSQKNISDIQILHQKYSLVDIISHIIQSFKEKLENETWEEINSILVWRPVRFHDTNTELDMLAENRLKEAFLKTGFKNVEFQYEPIWAFRAYANKNPHITQNNNKTLVIDLWWWTSDFSLFDINDWKIEILWNNWIYVWWDDIDKKIIYKYFSEDFWKNVKQKAMNWNLLDIPNHIFIDFSDKAKLLFFKEHEKIVKSIIPLLTTKEEKVLLWRLYEIFWDLSKWYEFHSKIEQWKINLTNTLEENFYFDMFENSFAKNLTRKNFEEIIYSEVEKIKKAIYEILTQTNTKPENINNVIINWWTGQIPVIREMVNNILGQWKILEGNNLSSVWYWLTLESYERFR